MNQKDFKNSINERKNPKIVFFGSSHGLLCFYTHFYYPNCICQGYEVLEILTSSGNKILQEYSIGENRIKLTSNVYISFNPLTPHKFADNIELINEDMMAANIENADIIVLASLCWDKTTKIKVSQKLAQELSDGSLIVDYTSDSFSPHVLNEKPIIYKSKYDLLDEMRRSLDSALHSYSQLKYPISDISKVDKLSNISFKVKSDPSSSTDNLYYQNNYHLYFNLLEIIPGQTSWSEQQNLYLYRKNDVSITF